jgi:rod shape determining protein RodA
VRIGATQARPHRSSGLERMLSLRNLSWMQVDWHILALAFALLAIGMLFVRGMDEADTLFDRNKIDFHRHVKTVLAALPAFFVGLLLRPRWLRRNAWAAYAVSIALLVAVAAVGAERNHARRWLPLGVGFDLQPSELAKLGLILALASVLHRNRLARLDEWLRPIGLTLLPMALVAMQPDLGTALTIVPVALGMLYVAGARARTLATSLCVCALIGVLAWQAGFLHAYQLQRVETWLGSWRSDHLIQNRNGPAFHTYHARVAIGNGGWSGTGLGQGVANEAAHLPERDCDSIFSVIAEEAGFLGTAGLLLLYALLIVLLLGSASQIRERFSRLVVSGVALYFAAHFFINTGVNLGLIPMTGLTLPLLSTGGSSLFTTFLALGLALGLAARKEPSFDQEVFG